MKKASNIVLNIVRLNKYSNLVDCVDFSLISYLSGATMVCL